MSIAMETGLDRQDIEELLGIAYPFLRVERVQWDVSTRTARSATFIDESIWFYKCHFIDEPMMPGVLQTEAMLQTIVTALCVEHKINAKHCLVNKSSVDFFDKIQGKGVIDIIAQLSIERSGIISATAVLNFNGHKTASGSFRFIIPARFKI